MKKKFYTVGCILIVFVLVSLACRLPFSGRDAETITPEVSVEPSTEVIAAAPEPDAQESLPPGLVEAAPAPGSTAALDQRFIFYFNQPMNQASVLENFSSEPALDWDFEWLDDSTLAAAAKGTLPISSELLLALAQGTKAQNGLVLSSELQLAYKTPPALLLTDQLPNPAERTVNPRGVLMAAFNQPVVSLGEDEGVPAFTLSPAADGYGEWINTSTYVFYPQPGLAGGIEYTLTLNENLTSSYGAPLILDDEQSGSWTFRTVFPELLSVEPDGVDPVELDAHFTLTFNQPMAAETVEANFSLKDASGLPLEGVFEWNSDISEMTFIPADLLSRNASYSANLGSSAQAMGGTALGQDYEYTFISVGDLAMQATSLKPGVPLEIYSGYGSVRVEFTSPLAEADYSELVQVEPAANLSYYLVDPYSLMASGYFSPSTSYSLTLSAEIEDRWGASLDQPVQIRFNTSAAKPGLTLPILQYVDRVVFMTPQDLSLPALATNLSGVSVQTAAIPMEDFTAIVHYPGVLDSYIPASIESWWHEFNLDDNANQPVDIPVSENENELSPGLYYYMLVAPEAEYSPQAFLVVVSSIQMVLKRSEGQLFIWATDLRNGSVLADAEMHVHLVSSAEPIVCVTDAMGVCRVDLPGDLDAYSTVVVSTGVPGQDNFGMSVDGWRMGVNGWDFDIETYRSQPDLLAYLYTDRSIYRPGQQVNFRLIVRDEDNARYTLPDLSQVQIEVYGDYLMTTGGVPLLETIPVTLSSFGSATGSFVLSEDAAPGYYSMQIEGFDDVYLMFQVAEYRKPEIDLQVQFTETEVLQGEDLQAYVSAAYYFGAAAIDTPLHWILYLRAETFDLPFGYRSEKFDLSGFDSGFWYPYYYPLGEFVIEGDGTTGSDGSLRIDIPFDRIETYLDAGSLQQLSLEVSLTDQNGIPVSSQAEVTLHPETYYIGLRPEQWNGSAGTAMGFAVQTADWNKNSVGGIALSASFQKVNWIRAKDEITGLNINVPDYSEASSASLTTDVNGQARIEFTPQEPGTYLLDVQGRQAVSQLLVWVAGSGSVSWPNLPNQQVMITTGQEAYRVGETASLFVPNPFESALALITVERAEVMRSFVVPVEQATLEFALPIEEIDAPNIYVGITLLNTGQNGGLDFRQGYVNLPVEPEALTLQVDLLADDFQQQPGGEVLLTLTVRDDQGSPVEGEFSVSLVDKALLALAEANSEDIITAFYGNQPLGVQNSLSLAGYISRIPFSFADGLGGGGGEMVAPYVREDFRDTAYWNGSVRTDAEGHAELRIDLPDNLTTWVVNVRGLDRSSRVGETHAEIVIGKDLLVRPVTPRFLVAEDHLQVGAIVHNQTRESLPVDVSILASGFTLDADQQELQRIIVPSGGSVRVDWWGTVEQVEQVDFQFSALAASLQDVTTPEQGAIPVLRYSFPQTYGTSGVLTENSELLEAVSLPRSFEPTGGRFTVELSPSLAAAILQDMKALKDYPGDFTESLLSRILPNFEMLRAIQLFGLDAPALEAELTQDLLSTIERLSRMQNADGGWGWTTGADSDAYISSYVLFGLTRGASAGFFIQPQTLQSAQDYLLTTLPSPPTLRESWQFDRLIFQYFALQTSGITDLDVLSLLDDQDQLNPWARALLALMLLEQTPGSESGKALVSDLQTSAIMSATGTHWAVENPSAQNYSSNICNHAVVLYALARLEPASSLVPNAVRYLVANRRTSGGWSSSYESAWALMALIEVMKSTGELQADYAFSATLNGQELLRGEAEGMESLTAVVSTTPIASLFPDTPNALRITKDSGIGKLYYRAYLQVDVPVEQALPLERGITIDRSYWLWGQDCSPETCEPLNSYSIGETDLPILVRLTVVIPEAMQYLVVEDWIPAGSEIVDTSLLTSQIGDIGSIEWIDPLDPFATGWGRWYFNQPQIFDERIRWVSGWVPAGTYVLTYRLTPYLAGNYHTLPAHAYQYYFPEVEGSSAGGLFTILP